MILLVGCGVVSTTVVVACTAGGGATTVAGVAVGKDDVNAGQWIVGN